MSSLTAGSACTRTSPGVTSQCAAGPRIVSKSARNRRMFANARDRWSPQVLRANFSYTGASCASSDEMRRSRSLLAYSPKASGRQRSRRARKTASRDRGVRPNRVGYRAKPMSCLRGVSGARRIRVAFFLMEHRPSERLERRGREAESLALRDRSTVLRNRSRPALWR